MEVFNLPLPSNDVIRPNTSQYRAMCPVYEPIVKSVLLLVVPAIVVPSSPIHVTLKMGTILPSETSVVTRATRRNRPGDGILRSHRREKLKSYMPLTGGAL
jgi:hypothetical protein